MSFHQFPSKLLEEAVFEFSKLPGIGDKTALRLVLHLLKQPEDDVIKFGQSLIKLKEEIIYCQECGNISDAETCNICANHQRDHGTVCVVENIKDVMAIERTSQFKGVYNVLGAIISPIDGVGPNHLFLKGLDDKIAKNQVNEIILGLNTTLEGDTTNFYLYKRYKNADVKISVLATGISIGNDLEYTDEITLGRSIMNRTQFNPGNK